jgi:ubiquinone/menaquinone biosynthesis C-methylase UbiE
MHTSTATPIANQAQKKLWMSPNMLAYHQRQLDTPYRSTVHLADFIEKVAGQGTGEALDIACGTGANILHMARRFPGYHWTGVDYAGDLLFPLGRKHARKNHLDVSMHLVSGDINQLTSVLPAMRFDLTLLMQTVLCLPDYQKAMEQALRVTRGWIFVSSLFTDFDIDAKIQVIDYTREDHLTVPEYYNVYSLEHFYSFCRKHGAKEFRSCDFEMDVDLPQSGRGRGTYTKMVEGHRVQFSGPLHMPWKFVAIRKGGYTA